MTLLTLVATSMPGCSGVRWLPLNGLAQATVATNPEALETFATQRPTRPYVELGTIEADVYSLEDPVAGFRRLREEAGLRGCDGLIVERPFNRPFYLNSQLRAERAVCIVFTEGPHAPPAPPRQAEPKGEPARENWAPQ